MMNALLSCYHVIPCFTLPKGNETIDTCGQCNRNQFKCLMDLQTCCIPMDWKCDHYVDCIDGSDENTTACLDVFLAGLRTVLQYL